MLHLLDTNLCIDLIRRHPTAVVERLEALHEGEVAMSLVTYAELRAGIEMQSRLRAAVPDRRRNAFDRLIAAHAIAANAVLVTNNEEDFDGYPGLTVENWIRGRESFRKQTRDNGKGPVSGAFSLLQGAGKRVT